MKERLYYSTTLIIKMKNKIKLNNEDKPMEIVDHLDEMRHRILICLSILVFSISILFYFSDILLVFFTDPFYKKVTNETLKIFNLPESLLLRLKSSLIVSILIVFPIILFNIWRYIRPAIDLKHRNIFRINFFLGLLLFYLGAAFAFFIMLPFSIEMFLKFKPPNSENLINHSKYLNMVFYFLFIMGTIFQLPVIINILTSVGLLTPEILSKKRKYAIVIIWVTAALLTPADILTQIIVATPLMFLYEIAILFSRITYRKKA